MSKNPEPNWLAAPETHDYAAAENYLSLILPTDTAHALALRLTTSGEDTEYKAKDILRASGLPHLAGTNEHVKSDIDKVKNGEKLSPILLIRGAWPKPLIVADGYHRVCAADILDEDAIVPCRIVDFEAK